MSTELEAVNGLLASARRKLHGLEQEANMVRAEIHAYERVVMVLSGADPSVVDRDSAGSERFATRRKRELSETWKFILAWIGRERAAPDTEAIWGFVQGERLDVQRSNLRSQLSTYTARGFLRREAGRYELTEEGAAAANGAFARLDARSRPTLVEAPAQTMTADPALESAA